MATHTTTQLLPAYTINGTGVNAWDSPNNILLVDGKFASTSNATAFLTLGGFNPNLAATDLVTNINLFVKGYRGSYNTTLQIYAVDDTTGITNSYPMIPAFQGFDGTNTLYSLPATLFGTTWTVDQINNLKIKLIADGELHIDAVFLSVVYDDGTPSGSVPVTYGQTVVDEFVQIQPAYLARSFTSTANYLFLNSLNYDNGDPVLIGDFYGEAVAVIDQRFSASSENIVFTNIEHNYNGEGLVRLTVSERGVKFKFPYTADSTLARDHKADAEFVISDSARFYNRFLKKAQIGALVSAPIVVKDEGTVETTVATSFNFVGQGVTASATGQDVTVTVAGNGINPPSIANTSSSTSGTVQVPTLTWSHVSSGVNRLLVVEVSSTGTVSGITYNGVALTLGVSGTNTSTWYLVAPPIGTYDIVVTQSSGYISAGAQTITTVNQATPVGASNTATGTSLAPSVVLTTTSNNSIVVDSLSTGVTPIVYTADPAQTLNWSHTANTDARQGASSIELAGTAPDAVTMSYAITQNTAWSMTALEIIGVSNATIAGVSQIVAGTGVTISPTGGTGAVTINATGATGVNSVTGEYVNDTDPANPVIETPRLNAANSTDPTVSNDVTQGYRVGSHWLNKATNALFVATDVTTGAAVWAPVAGSGGAGGGTKLFIDTTVKTGTFSNHGAVFYSFTIPGGTLSTNNAIRINPIALQATSGNNGDYGNLELYCSGTLVGTASIVSNNAGGSGSTANWPTFTFTMTAQGTTSSQICALSGTTFYSAGSAVSFYESNQNTTFDSTINNTFEIKWNGNTGSNSQVIAKGIIVEKIVDSGSMVVQQNQILTLSKSGTGTLTPFSTTAASITSGDYKYFLSRALIGTTGFADAQNYLATVRLYKKDSRGIYNLFADSPSGAIGNGATVFCDNVNFYFLNRGNLVQFPLDLSTFVTIPLYTPALNQYSVNDGVHTMCWFGPNGNLYITKATEINPTNYTNTIEEYSISGTTATLLSSTPSNLPSVAPAYIYTVLSISGNNIYCSSSNGIIHFTFNYTTKTFTFVAQQTVPMPSGSNLNTPGSQICGINTNSWVLEYVYTDSNEYFTSGVSPSYVWAYNQILQSTSVSSF